MNCSVPTSVSSPCVLLSLAYSRMLLFLVLNYCDIWDRKVEYPLEITTSVHGFGDGKRGSLKPQQAGLDFQERES